MGIFEFLLALVGMLIIGVWGLIFISHRCGLIDNEKDDKKEDK